MLEYTCICYYFMHMINAHAHHKAPPNTNVVIVKMSTTPPSTPSKRRKGEEGKKKEPIKKTLPALFNVQQQPIPSMHYNYVHSHYIYLPISSRNFVFPSSNALYLLFTKHRFREFSNESVRKILLISVLLYFID